MPVRKLKVYLAGPITNCNSKQKTEWRKRLRQRLLERGFECLDPTDRNAQKGPLAVITDVEETDVVIANMWRESIGTVMGMVHARRIGVPVILVDPNFIESELLETIVDYTVENLDGALHILQREIAPTFTQQRMVRKRDGAEAPFSQRKLQISVKKACAEAGIDDTVLPIALCQYVYRTIMRIPSQGSIPTEQIKDMVFQEVGRFSTDDRLAGGAGQRLLPEQAKKFREAWEYHEMEKSDESPWRQLERAHKETEELASNLAEAEQEKAELRTRLSSLSPSQADDIPATSFQGPQRLQTILANELGERPCLCVCQKGRCSFRSAFERKGLSQEDFSRFFIEYQLDGKQSNLGADLRADLKKYPYVLYAAEGLRHLPREAKEAANLVWGAGPNDAVRRFIRRLDPPRQPAS